jgi:hypothetical protein
MAVGDDQAIMGDDEAGTAPAAFRPPVLDADYRE